MSTTVHPSVTPYTYADQHPTLLTRFITWTKNQESNRFLWLALALGGHGCVLTPLTILLVVAFTGMHFALFMTALAAMALALIVNLAALPTKITIPAFLLSVLADLVVIAIAIGMALS